MTRPKGLSAGTRVSAGFFISCLIMLSACAGMGGSFVDVLPVSIAVLKGPTAIGMVSLMDRVAGGEITSYGYSFEIAGSVDEIVPRLARGEIDIAAVPANLSSILYHNTGGGVQVLAIHTLGMIAIVENGETVFAVADLRGRTVMAAGKGGPQEFTLNHILEANGLVVGSDVFIEWKSEHTEVAASLLAGGDAVAMLPQPFATTVRMADENVRIALDLNEEWDKIQSPAAPGALIMGVMVARSDFVRDYPAVVDDFLGHYAASIAYANDNIDETAALVAKYDIFPAAVARMAIPDCKITFITGDEMREKLSGFFAILHGQDQKSIGGALPDDEFYYGR